MLRVNSICGATASTTTQLQTKGGDTIQTYLDSIINRYVSAAAIELNTNLSTDESVEATRSRQGRLTTVGVPSATTAGHCLNMQGAIPRTGESAQGGICPYPSMPSSSGVRLRYQSPFKSLGTAGQLRAITPSPQSLHQTVPATHTITSLPA